MISFREYLQQELTKTNDEQVKNTAVIPVKKERTIEDELYDAKPEIWTARVISDVKYLIYNGKLLNITQLKEDLNKIYTEKGYPGYGFSKLNEHELIRYTKVKNIIIQVFAQDLYKKEIPSEVVAEKLFMNEIKDFEWKPEEY